MAVQTVPEERHTDHRTDRSENGHPLARSVVRTNCYEIEIRGDGTVEYTGHAFVALRGRHRATLARDEVRDLYERFRRADFFWLNGRYFPLFPPSHGSSRSIAISFDGVSKEVLDGDGLRVGMPDIVRDLENAVEDLVDAERWTKGNKSTAPSLVAEGWNFRSPSNDNRSIVGGLTAYGEADALRAVIALGAPVAVDAELRQTPRESGGPKNALDAAVVRGDPEILKVLLAARAPWTRQQFGEALLKAAERGRISIVGPIIAAGGDPRYTRPGRRASERERGLYRRDGEGLRTVLMSAARSGVVEVVEAILRFKPNVNARDEYGWTALHYAVGYGGSSYDSPPTRNRSRIVELLLRAGADANARTDAGDTPLMIEDIDPATADVLVKAGAKRAG